jgi:hypothetical protein
MKGAMEEFERIRNDVKKRGKKVLELKQTRNSMAYEVTRRER